MRVQLARRVDTTTDEDISALGLAHKCESRGREVTKQRERMLYTAQCCDGGRTSRLGSSTDKAVRTARRRRAVTTLSRVIIGLEPVEHVLSFVYPGESTSGMWRRRDRCTQSYGQRPIDFGSLGHLWRDHRLSLAKQLKFYRLSVNDSFVRGMEPYLDVDANNQRLQRQLPIQVMTCARPQAHLSMICYRQCENGG